MMPKTASRGGLPHEDYPDISPAYVTGHRTSVQQRDCHEVTALTDNARQTHKAYHLVCLSLPVPVCCRCRQAQEQPGEANQLSLHINGQEVPISYFSSPSR